MDGKLLARLGAVVFVAVAVTATAIEITRIGDEPEAPALSARSSNRVDPLRAELRRCATIGEAGARDAACLRAWAENRRRFLAPAAKPTGRLPDPPATLRSAPTIAPAEIPPANNSVLKETAPVITPDADEDQ
ncbi:putative entry exclusion protein TrbK-alt [Sinorhizobium meliloti]|nr:putative entry exclusion protein TrbK-alt [Sinorhizobium meliloti]MDW9918466.1 putative entry exclusion protein TrbK-alt [Sinorhizobium meliloti]MDW9949612.1 putative entry exclusion protein TrbK-alt [Sinorhizobium meliloti]